MEVGREKDGDSEEAKRRWWKRADEAELDIPSNVGKARSVLLRSEPCWSSAPVDGETERKRVAGSERWSELCQKPCLFRATLQTLSAYSLRLWTDQQEGVAASSDVDG